MRYKVAQLISSTQDGGAETLVKDYALLLDKDKFDVIIIVRRRIGDTANDRALVQNGVKVISIFKNNNFLFRVVQKLNYWWYIPWRLKQILKQESVDILHIHLDMLQYLGKISDNIKGIKLFYTCHSLPKRFFKGKCVKNGKVAKKLIKNNYLTIVALHKDMQNEINEMFGTENTVVIRNGVNFERFRSVLESKEEIRKSIGIPNDVYVIGHVGRFSYPKNHEFIIDIFSEVYLKKKNAFLLLVGSGELLHSIKAKIKHLGLENRVLILANRSDIPQLLKAMDVFVFPSRFEGLPVSVIEAQVSGLRCIVSDSVPQEALKMESTVSLSLNESAKKWSDVILDDTIKGKLNGSISDYDMNLEIKRLEKLYLGEDNA